MSERFISLDPSGNFHEGKGTTGFAIFENDEVVEFGDVKASDYDSDIAYWLAVGDVIVHANVSKVVIESYILFLHKSKAQTGSALETSQLIGYLRTLCHHLCTPCLLQPPSIKVRVTDNILTKKGVFVKKGTRYTFNGQSTNLHQRDAIRHGLYYIRFGKK